MAKTIDIVAEARPRIQDFVKQEFGGLMREPRTAIYHYSDTGAVAAILEAGALRATNLVYLDDGREIGHMLDCLDQAIDARRRERPGQASDRLAHTIDRHLAGRGQNVPPDVWVAALTERRESAPHWQAHCGDGGACVALGFSPTKLLRAAADEGVLLAPCCYDDGAKVGLMGRALDLLDRAIEDANRKYGADGEIEDRLVFAVMREAALFGALFKPADQAWEQEWRLVLCNVGQTPVGAKRIHAQARPDHLSLYVDMTLEAGDHRLPLTEIMVGPSERAQLTQRAIRTLLYKHGYENVGVSLGE